MYVCIDIDIDIDIDMDIDIDIDIDIDTVESCAPHTCREGNRTWGRGVLT